MAALNAKEIADIYRRCASTGQVVSGDLSLNDSVINIQSKWTMIDVDLNSKIAHEKCYQSSNGINHFKPLGVARNISESEVMNVKSPSGSLTAVLKEITKDNKKCQYVEVWDANGRKGVYDCTSADDHGKVITKGTFVAFEWSPDETKILIHAEKKSENTESLFAKKASVDAAVGGEFRWKEDWGEQMDGCASPIILVIDVSEFTAEVIANQVDATMGQAVFTPDSKGVIFMSVPNTPYRLGSIFCNNRLSNLMHYNMETKTFKEIGEGNKCIFSPRFTPNGKYLLYLQNEVGGPHQMGAQLMKHTWGTDKKEVLVDVQKNPKEDEYPGLYHCSIKRNCISDDKVYINTYWHSRQVILSIDVSSGQVENLTVDEKYGAWQVLSVRGNFILSARSSPSILPHLVIAELGKQISWVTVGDVKSLPEVKWELVMHHPTKHPDYYFESLYIRKGNTSTKHPIILFPHGGPHSNMHAAFTPSIHFMIECGYGVVIPNYRGSLGFGERNLLSLSGNVGDYDVKDVQQSIDYALTEGEADPSRVYLFGGSHGGFLTAHLIGQYPDFYKAACLRNPVIDLATKVATDIPDWLWYEANLEGTFQHSSLPTDQDLAKAHQKSPIVHAHKIKTPAFFFLGTGDQRVDKSQGVRLYKYLKARNVECRCNMYDDNHSFSTKVIHEADFLVNSVLWFQSHP